MKMLAKQLFFCVLVISLLAAMVGCSGNTQWATYDDSQDAAFLPKDIFSPELYAPGIVLGQSGQYCLEATEKNDVGAFVLKGEYGKCYEVKIPAGVPEARAAKFAVDPRTFSVGQQLEYTSSTSFCTVLSPDKEVAFMYTCRKQEEYLVIYTGSSNPVYIGERNIIAETDTNGPWYIPESVGSIAGDATLGDLFSWSAQEMMDNLYEPVRNRYTNYITREHIGKDSTGKYDMYCYVYEPKNYEFTIFLAGGMHADEGVGYYSLAKIMQLIADATAEDTLLYTLRQKVRFVVIPVINVWGVSHGFVRTNGNKEDLNRDFDDLSQQESKNVMNCFAKYADDAVLAMDFHISQNQSAELWFNFINFTDNAVVNYKTTNHIYHRYQQLGYTEKETDLVKLPGSYKKSDQYFEGRIWNEYGVPTITVEYTTNYKTPAVYTDDCMTLAVETYINFIIQNALFYLQ